MKTQTININQTIEMTKKFDLQLRAILLSELRAIRNNSKTKIAA
jgi:hypothetical protein